VKFVSIPSPSFYAGLQFVLCVPVWRAWISLWCGQQCHVNDWSMDDVSCSAWRPPCPQGPSGKTVLLPKEHRPHQHARTRSSNDGIHPQSFSLSVCLRCVGFLCNLLMLAWTFSTLAPKNTRPWATDGSADYIKRNVSSVCSWDGLPLTNELVF